MKCSLRNSSRIVVVTVCERRTTRLTPIYIFFSGDDAVVLRVAGITVGVSRHERMTLEYAICAEMTRTYRTIAESIYSVGQLTFRNRSTSMSEFADLCCTSCEKKPYNVCYLLLFDYE